MKPAAPVTRIECFSAIFEHNKEDKTNKFDQDLPAARQVLGIGILRIDFALILGVASCGLLAGFGVRMIIRIFTWLIHCFGQHSRVIKEGFFTGTETQVGDSGAGPVPIQPDLHLLSHVQSSS